MSLTCTSPPETYTHHPTILHLTSSLSTIIIIIIIILSFLCDTKILDLALLSVDCRSALKSWWCEVHERVVSSSCSFIPPNHCNVTN